MFVGQQGRSSMHMAAQLRADESRGRKKEKEEELLV